VYSELMPRFLGPTHGQLYKPVQLVDRGIGSNEQPTPRHRTNITQRHVKLVALFASRDPGHRLRMPDPRSNLPSAPSIPRFALVPDNEIEVRGCENRLHGIIFASGAADPRLGLCDRQFTG
jgi:hypothetical protein